MSTLDIKSPPKHFPPGSGNPRLRFRSISPSVLPSLFQRGILDYGFARVRCPECKHDRIHPRHGGDSRRFDPLDFIAQIVLHIPDVHEKTVIYYGWYSNRTRARRAKLTPGGDGAPATHAPAGEPKLPLAVRCAWAAMIKRVYEVDPLIRPHCKATMRIVSYIEDEDVIHKILKHLDLLGKDPPVGDVRVRGAPAPPAKSA